MERLRVEPNFPWTSFFIRDGVAVDGTGAYIVAYRNGPQGRERHWRRLITFIPWHDAVDFVNIDGRRMLFVVGGDTPEGATAALCPLGPSLQEN